MQVEKESKSVEEDALNQAKWRMGLSREASLLPKWPKRNLIQVDGD